MADSNKQYEYFAFISYKREDEKWAKWLQRKLEYYKLPSSVRRDNPDLPEKIRPVFKDTTDLEPGVLAQKIQDALNSSKFLIVICSPRSANSVWVSKEVQSFIDSGRADHIIPFIIGGTPNATDPKDECFPEGLRQLAGEQELLGANINEMGREAAAIKVVARMFNLRFDTLWQRYEKYLRRKRLLLGLLLVAIAFLTLTIASIIANQNAMLQKTNLKLEVANTSIRLQRDSILHAKNEINVAYDSIANVLGQLGISNQKLLSANNSLQEANQQLKTERDNVKREMKEKTINYYKNVASSAIANRDFHESLALLSSLYECTADYSSSNPDVPEVIYAINQILNSNEGEGVLTQSYKFPIKDVYPDIIGQNKDEFYLLGNNGILYSISNDFGTLKEFESGIQDWFKYDNIVCLIEKNKIRVLDPNKKEINTIPLDDNDGKIEIKYMDDDLLIYINDSHNLICKNIKQDKQLWSRSNIWSSQAVCSNQYCVILDNGINSVIDTHTGVELNEYLNLTDLKHISLHHINRDTGLLTYSDKSGMHIFDINSKNNIFNFSRVYIPEIIDDYVYVLQRNGNRVQKYDLNSKEKVLEFDIDLGIDVNNPQAGGRKVNIRGVNSEYFLVLTTSRANSLMSLWSIKDGLCKSKIPTDVTKIESVYLCDNNDIVTIDKDNNLKYWVTNVSYYNIPRLHNGRINDFAISDDLKYRLSVSLDSTAVISDLDNHIIHKIKINEEGNTTIWDNYNNEFVIGCNSGKILSINPLYGSIKPWPTQHSSIISSMQRLPDGRILTSAMDNLVTLWNRFHEIILSFQASDNEYGYVANANFGDSNLILSSNWNPNSITLYNIEDHRIVIEIKFPHAVMNAFFINSNDFVVLSDSELYLCKKEGKDYFKSIISPEVLGLEKNPANETFAYVTNSNNVVMYDSASGEQEFFNTGNLRPYYLTYSPDGKLLMVIAKYGNTNLSWILNSETLIPITSFAFKSPAYFGRIIDNKTAVYAMLDGSFRKHHIPSYKETISRLKKAISSLK